MINQLNQLMDKIESIGIACIVDGTLKIKGTICYYYIPIGLIDYKELNNDIRCNCFNSLLHYITIVPIYSKVYPITFDLMTKKLHLHKDVCNYLKKYQLHIYEVDIKIDKKENYNVIQRSSKTEVNINLPPDIPTGNINWCMCSAYQPDKIYFISTFGLFKEE